MRFDVRPAVLAPMVALALVLVGGACGGTSPQASGPTTSASSTTANASSTTGAPTTGAPTTTAPVSTPAWLTYGGNFSRTSVDTSGPPFNRSVAAAWTSPDLDGAVYGEPLIDDGQVFVATENDTVYALSATNGTVVWSDHVGTPVPAGALPCGDITPDVGITSTMVIDPTSGTLFASGAEMHGGAVRHWVFAFDIATHRLLWSRDVDEPGWTASAQLQRTGLALSDGRVVLGFGGNYGDCGTYHGWLVAVPESGTGPLLSYEVPTAREGAIWAPAGVTVDATGDVFAVTGNGAAGPGQPFDYGDAVIEVSPQLVERQYFAPTNWAQDNSTDADLSSTAAILLGGTQLFIVGKEQTAYLLDAASLGGIGGQVASLPVCNARGGNAYLAPDVFVACPLDGTIDEVRVGPGNALSRGWTWRSPTGGASSPTIAGGVLWCIDLDASVLYGVSPASGATLFRRPLDVGTPPHFEAPAAAGGLVVVAGSKAVEAFR